ncbi:MFS transporter [Pseudorhodobacter sp.]|uniref:MFS transporter n=1 Tax=Pseudorhodobacter sp. TaxID=1934400 RepID=UPI002AFE2056|nr:MFS transporter [Pseudorhodobacter sp.]
MPPPNILMIARAPLAAFAVMGVAWGTFAAVLPDLKGMLGVDEAQLGLLLFLTPVTAVLAMLAAPAFGAALGRLALPLATVMMALSFALPGMTASLLLFPLAMMACGAATGLTDVLMNARVAALENTHARPLMNLCHALYSLGYAVGALTTGAMRNAGAAPGLVMGSLALLALLLSLFTWDKAGRIEGLSRPATKAAARLGTLPLIGGAIVLVAFMTENAAESWSALHIEKTLGGSPAQGALGPATLALTMAAARLGGQALIQRIAPIRLLRWGAGVASIGALIAALATSPAMAYAGFIVMGIGASVIAPTAFSLVGSNARPEARARAVARATLLGYFGYFFGPPVLGLIAGSFGLRAAFVATALGISLVLILAPMMARAKR